MKNSVPNDRKSEQRVGIEMIVSGKGFSFEWHFAKHGTIPLPGLPAGGCPRIWWLLNAVESIEEHEDAIENLCIAQGPIHLWDS